MNRTSIICAALLMAFASSAHGELQALLARDGRIAFGDRTRPYLSVKLFKEKGGWRDAVATDSMPDGVAGIGADTVSWLLRERGGEVLAHGTTQLTAAPEGRAAFRTELVSAIDQEVAGGIHAMVLPASIFAGCRWTADDKSGTLPAVADRRVKHLFIGEAHRFSMSLPDGDAVDFRFDVPTYVHVQDGRSTGFGDRFWVRIGGGAGKFKKGDRRVVSGTVGMHEPLRVGYVRIAAGPDWIALDHMKDIEAGSALDFSRMGLQDAPAGKHGWLKAVGGHFEFENLPGVKQRFYGVNLCNSATTPTHEESDMLVARLVRLGYNTIRVHHYENDLLRGRCGLEFDQEKLERFDYLIAKAIQNGLYVTIDLYVSRSVAHRDIGLGDRAKKMPRNQFGKMPKNLYKCLVATWDPAFENWCAFSRKLLEHVNPYTGRSYLDEPAMPMISLINEGPLTISWKELREDPIGRDAWAKWLAERRAADPGFCPDAPADAKDVCTYDYRNSVKGRDDAVFSLFMADVERRSVSRMTGFLRRLGSRALFTNSNCRPHFAPVQFTCEDCYDYVDDHFYVDHPRFPGRSWALPSYCDNENPVLLGNLRLTNVAFTRLADKPFTVSEWNFCGPGRYRGVGGIMTGAFSALQDWDGLWRFDYSKSSADIAGGSGLPGYFDSCNDPLGQASDRATVCLFLRRDLSSLDAAESYQVTEAALPLRGGNVFEVAPVWMGAAWGRQVSTCTDATKVRPGAVVRPLAVTHSATNAPFASEPNPEFSIDRAHGTFRIDTPRTSGGFAPKGALECGALSFAVRGDLPVPTTVWASSVDSDATPVVRARRILVTHLTDVQADGNVYAEKECRTLLKWGRSGIVARRGEADVSLALETPGAYEVWGLDTAGHRMERVPSSVDGGRLRFNASVSTPRGARLFYEVSRK